MTTDEWETIALLIEEGWPGEFTDNAANAWRVLLDGFTAAELLSALKRLALRGGKFRPSVAEVAGEIQGDVSAPTFPEFQTMIYGPGGVMSAGKKGVNEHRRVQMAETGSSWIDQGDSKRAFDHAAQAHADRLHQLVGSFVARYGLARLQNLELDNPEYGMLRRKDLEREWGEHVEISGHRDAAHVASGDRRGELGRFDPLDYLRQPTAPALGRGEEAA